MGLPQMQALLALGALLSCFFRMPDAKVMNDGGVPYVLSNPGPTGEYVPDFDEATSEHVDVYGEIQTRYSQVYWTRNDPVPLPEEIVKRFDGKVMAITGYEIDQVVKDPSGDKSIPIYNAYNHHYFGWLMGKDAEMYQRDAPINVPNPTSTGVRDLPNTHGFPTNIVFKENPGGEYRKSYHGYPRGYAQLIHSPQTFVLEPMQIDTHNRKFGLTDPAGHQPSFLPRSDDLSTGYNDPHSGLSPLIECPCGTRITRSVQNTSSILTSGTCSAEISSEQACRTAIEAMVSVSASKTINDVKQASGCLMVPDSNGQSYSSLFNIAKSSQSCGDAHPAPGSESLHGATTSLVNISIAHDGKEATFTLTGPADVWFGVGLNAQTMKDQPYAIIVDGHGAVVERKLVEHGPGSILTPSVKMVSNTVNGARRTVVMTRLVAGASKDHYSLPTTPGALNIINAVGNGPTFAYHKARTGAKIFLLPTKASACLCAPKSSAYLTYMNTSVMAYEVDCGAEPRTDMNQQHNPACQMHSYHGGLHCCHHKWFLTDLEQDQLVPAAVDTYYLKWRFYFAEYTPATAKASASHQHLHHWVFLIDANVNDYEEVQCQEGYTCRGSITARLTASEMGLEDTPKAYKGITSLVITPHCHAPSCIREELYNADTGALICGVTARYGNGTEVFNEANYIAIPPCLFGDQAGLHTPITIEPGTRLRAIKYFNTTYRHVGQMAQWTGLMVYDTDPYAWKNDTEAQKPSFLI